jgi:hypothetical protein
MLLSIFRRLAQLRCNGHLARDVSSAVAASQAQPAEVFAPAYEDGDVRTDWTCESAGHILEISHLVLVHGAASGMGCHCHRKLAFASNSRGFCQDVYKS